MVKDLTLQNFRCFKEQRLEDLRRVNVIVGDNSSGKTTLLEALFLLGSANAQVVLRLRSQRGMGESVVVSRDSTFTDDLWRDFFFDLDMSRPLMVAVTDSDARRRSVVVGRPQNGSAGTLVPLDGKPSIVMPVEFTWSVGEQSSTVDVRVSADGLLLGVASVPAMPMAYFYSTAVAATPSEAANRYSQLSIMNREDEFLESIKAIYPFIRRLSVESNTGGSMLYAQVHGVAKKVPLSVVSQGVSKLVQLLLGIQTYPKGVVLVDELESGIYYKKFPLLWSALLTESRRLDTQLFVTTHSRECLEALRDTMKGQEKEFCLIRAERRDVDGNTLKRFDGTRALTALEEQIELR